MLELELHDGTVAEFPDGTPQEKMLDVARRYRTSKMPDPEPITSAGPELGAPEYQVTQYQRPSAPKQPAPVLAAPPSTVEAGTAGPEGELTPYEFPVTEAQGPVSGVIEGAAKFAGDVVRGGQKNIERNFALPLRWAGAVTGNRVLPPEAPEGQRSVMPGVATPSVTAEQPRQPATVRSAEGRPTTPIATQPSPSTDPGTIARNLADVVPEIPGRVYRGAVESAAGNVQTIADMAGAEGLSQTAARMGRGARSANLLSEMKHPAMDQFLVRNTVSGLQSVPQSLLSLGIAAITPGGVAAKLSTSLLPFFMGAQGQSYSELTAAGFTPEQARFYSTAQGISEAGTEVIPMRALVGLLQTGPGKFLSQSLSYMWKEGMTEEVNTVVNHAIDLATTRPDLKPGQMAQELLDTAASIAVTGLGTVGAAGIVRAASAAKQILQSSERTLGEALNQDIKATEFNQAAIDAAARGAFDPNRAQMTSTQPPPRPGTAADLARAAAHPGGVYGMRAEDAQRQAAAERPEPVGRVPVVPPGDVAAAPQAAGATEQTLQKGENVEFDLGQGPETGTVAEIRPGDDNSPGGYVVVEFEGGGTMEMPIGDVRPITKGASTPEEPVEVKTATDIESAISRIDQDRSNEQIIAGNDRKAHIKLQGFNITIESGKGQIRRDAKNTPPKWEVTMPAHYGFLKRTEGADGEGVDVYIGDEPMSPEVWVIDQIDPATENFDEHKAMLGFPDAKTAMQTYAAGFSDGSGQSRMGAITHMTMEQFREWVKTEDTTKPVSYVKQKAQPPAQPPTGGPTLPPTSQTGLDKAGGEMAGAITEGMYDRLFADFQAGKTDEAGAPSTVLQVLQAIKKAGGEVTRENLPAIAKEITGIKDSLKGEEFQTALRVLVQRYAKGGDHAGEIRGDEGQVQGPGTERPGGEGQGGPDIQRPTGEGPGPGYQKPQGEPAGELPQPPVEPPVNRFEQPRRSVFMGAKGQFHIDMPDRTSATAFDIGARYRMTARKGETEDQRVKRIASAREMAQQLAKQFGTDEKTMLLAGGAYREQLLEAVKKLGAYTGANDTERTFAAPKFDPKAAVKEPPKTPEPKEPKAPKEPKPPKPEKPELTANEKLHVEIQNAIAANDRSALAKIIYQDMPHGEENLPTIDEADKLVRLVIKIDYREKIEGRLRDLEFTISDRQDVTDTEAKDPIKMVKLSALYRPPQKMIQDIGEKIGGKRADENPGTTIDKVPAGDAEKAVAAILNAVRKDVLLTHELPGQSFGQMMFLEALWDKIMAAGESFVPHYERSSFKQYLIRSVERDPQHNLPKLKEAAKGYAEILVALQKSVEGKKRVGETADALISAFNDNAFRDKVARLIPNESPIALVKHFRQRYEQNEDSTDQTNRAVKKDPEPPTITEIIRKGDDWRKGKNVEDTDFQNTFGFRGVDFGDWVTGEERQAGLNMAYDGLMDMAKVMGLPPSVIGLGKKLALGFGARGRGGKAAATYHPDNVVINLTRTRGNGTVSHEWQHGLEDHMLKYAPVSAKAYARAMREAMQHKINTAGIEQIVRLKLSETITSGSDRNVPPKERALKWLNEPEQYMGWWDDDNTTTRPGTTFRRDAIELDGGERGKYWSKPEELIARSWEGFMFDETKGNTPYLVGPHVEPGYITKKNGFGGTAYPDGKEREYFQKIWRMYVEGLEVTDEGVRVKADAKTVMERLKAEMQAEADAVKGRLDKIMEEMNIAQAPELKDGSMMQSMFYHLRHGWWPKDKIALRRFVAEAHKVDPKEIDDLKLRDGVEDFEAALARFAGQLVNDWKQQGLNERQIYDKLFEMYDKQPRLDVRTSEVVLNQQYSTPLPIAFGAGLLGHVDSRSVVFDATAGNGLLVIGANPKNVIANEMSDRRFKNLQMLEFRAHHGDALTAKERKVYKPQEADTLLFNPPFGLLTDPQEREGYTLKRIDQLIAMDNMSAMADKGRAVLILGASMTPGLINQNEMDFFHWLYTNYNVVDHFEVTGKLYERQGASWPIRVIVIAGRSPSKLPPLEATKPGVIDRVENRNDLWTRISEARDKAANPVAGGVSPRVVGPGKQPGGKMRPGKPADVGPGVPGGVVGQGGGPTLPAGGKGGETGGTGRAPVGDGAVGPGQVPAGGRPGGVGGESPADAGLRPGEPGGPGAGESGGGEVGGGESGLPDLDATDLGGTELTDSDLDDIFGAPEKKPRAKGLKGGPSVPRGPRAPSQPREAAPISTGDKEQDDILNAMRAILEGRAEQPKPPTPPKTVGKPKSEALTMAVYRAVESKLARDGDWWIPELAKRVSWPAEPANKEDLAPRFARGDLDSNILKKLWPHFNEMWSRISAVAKDFKDRVILFRDRVIQTLGDTVIPYARAFIQAVMAEAEKAKRELTAKKPIDNAVETNLQKFYVGLSEGENRGIMAPADQLLAQKRALAGLDSRIRNEYPGGVDEFVQKMVGYDSIEEMNKHLGGYQIDTIGLAIESMMNYRGFIIGDDTGVGKGRQAAAIIAWAVQGGKVPIFLTAGDTLYSDMYRDMRDIGKDNIDWIQPTNANFTITDEEDRVLLSHKDSEEGSARILSGIREKLAAAGVDTAKPETYLPEGKKVIFSTYDQLKGGGSGPRRATIEALLATKNAVLILDEAHKASGASGVGGWLTTMLNTHKPPTTYLSATWAKRPDNLYVYSQTDIHLIAAKFEDVVETIKHGGPQMQTVISEMLVEAGQMVRRERSYNGIKPVFDIDDTNSAKDARTMDEVTERLRDIQAANREFKTLDPKIIDQIVKTLLPWTTNVKKNDLKVDPLNFASVVHNYVKQFMLAVKADRTIEMVIEAYNRGEKPVIALENTMESALDYYVESSGINKGGSLDGYTWATVMRKAEESARRLTIKVPGRNEPVRLVVPLNMLPGDIAAAFQRAQESIDTFQSDLPVSPIDYMLWKLQGVYTWKAGGKDVFGVAPPEGAKARPLKWGEITGRTLTVDYQEDGSTVLGARDKSVRKRSIIIDYQNGDLDGAILNISGSTGISMHASEKAKDQRPRHMLIAQALADIAEFKQISGRINRTGQVELPLYTFIGTALPSEKRPLSNLQKKLRSLTSQTSAGTQSVYDIDTTDFINQYGDEIVTRWLRANPDMAGLLNMDVPGSEASVIEGGAAQASGRISVLPVADQLGFYDEIETAYSDYIQELTAAGRNKLITSFQNLQGQLLSSNQIVEGEPFASSPFVAPADLQQLSVLTQHTVPKPEAIIEMADKARKDLPILFDIEQDLKLPFDEAMNQIALRIQDYQKRLQDPSLPASERDRIGHALQHAQAAPVAFAARKQETLNALRVYEIGSVYTINYDDQEMTGVIVGRQYTKQKSGNPYAPSRFHFSIITNTPRPTLRLSLASIENMEDPRFWGLRHGRLGEQTRDRAIRQIEQDFDPTAMLREGGREKRFIVVGNIPAGFNAVKNVGEIMRFTYSGHTPESPKIRTGVLMPQKFNPQTGVKETQPVRNLDAAERFVMLPYDYGVVEGTNTPSADMAEASKKRWIDFGYTAKEIFDVSAFGITDNDGQIKLSANSKNGYLSLQLKHDSRLAKTKKARDEFLAGLQKIGIELHARKGQNWNGYPEAKQVPALLKFISDNYGLTIKQDLRPFYKRIVDHISKPEGPTFARATKPRGAPNTLNSGQVNAKILELRDQLGIYLKRKLPPKMFTRGSLSESDLAVVKKLESFFGKNVVVVRNNNASLAYFEGVTLPSDPQTIYLSEQAIRPLVSIIGHEFLHTLKRTNPALYAELLAKLRPLFRNTETYHKWLNAAREKEGQEPAGMELVEEEMLGDVVGDALMDSRVLSRLYGEAPTLWQKILQAIMDLLDSIGLHLRTPLQSHRYLTDLAQARSIVEDLLQQKKPAGELATMAEEDFRVLPPDVHTAIRKDREAFTKQVPTFARTYSPGPIPPYLADQLAGVDLADVKIIKSSEEYKQFFGRYGLPNAMMGENGFPFGNTASLFVDDEKNGKPVAIAIPKPSDPTFSRGIPSQIHVEQRPEFGDILGLKKSMWLPREAFRTYPLLGELQRFAMKNEVAMSKTLNRVMDEYETMRKPFVQAMVKLDENRWMQLTELVLREDAEQKEYTPEELAELGVTDEKVLAGHKAYRTLTTRLGRLVDMHRRSMMPKMRERKASLLRQMARLRNMSDPEFAKRWAERERLKATVRRQSRGSAAAATRLAEIERELQEMREGLEEYQEMAAEVDQIDAKLAETSIRRKTGYFPHKFFGTFAAYDIQERDVVDENGDPVLDDDGNAKTETHHVLIAGKDGFHATMGDAIEAAKNYLAEHPNADLVVRPVEFKFPNSNATTLTDASYGKFTRDVSSEFGLHGQDLYDVIKGVAKKRFRRRIAGFTMFRKGVEGFSKDLDKVMRAHIGQVVNYVYLDKLKYQAITTQEQAGLSPAKASRRGMETLATMFDNYIRDLNNLKQPNEIRVDEFINKLMDKPWATPATVGASVGGMTALPLMAGISTNPLGATLLGTYVGWRFYDSLKKGGQFPSRTLTSDMMSDMAHAKLGMFFNVMSAVVNMTQTITNTLPVLGPKYTMVGMVKLEEALRSFIQFKLGVNDKPNGDWRLLERTDLVSVNRYSDEAGRALLSRRGLLGYASLIFFDTAEKFNRATAFLGGYYREHDKGKTPGESFRAGESVLEFTQHHYGNASKPEILRNIFLRVPLQFKNFFAQQIGFTWELGRYGVTGERHTDIPEMNRAAIVTHLLSLTLLAGVLGLPVWWFFSILALLFDWDAEAEMKRWLLKAQASGEVGAATWKVLIKGFPAMLGEDLSGRAGMGDQFFPSSQRDVRGPWISTIQGAVQIGENQGTLVDQLSNAVPGVGKPLKVFESMANGIPLESLIGGDTKTFYESLQDDKLYWRNRMRSGMADYDETLLGKNPVPGPLGITRFPTLERMAVGSTPVELSEGRDRLRVIGEMEKRQVQKAKLYRNLVVNAIFEHQGDEEKLDKVLDNILSQMERQGYEPTKQTTKGIFENAMTPREERALRRAPKTLRPEIEALFPRQNQSDQIPARP